MTSQVDPHVFVIFGGTGDLAQRKLIPSLYRLITDHEVRDRCVVIGVSRREVGDAAYRDWAKEALVESGLDGDEVETWCQGNLHHQALSDSDSGYAALRERIESIEAETDPAR